MDKYLVPNACFKRLYNEYHKHDGLYGAFDFDDTVFPCHNKDSTCEFTIKLIRDLYSIGCKLNCWTAKRDHDFVRSYLKENNIPFEEVNGDGIGLPYKSRKPYHSFVLDDRAGLESLYRDLDLLVFIIKKEKGIE